MPGNAERWASLAAEKLTAKSVEAGQYDLILDPTNLWLTIHESIGHPDRARSRDRRGSQLRRHELRRAAREDDRPAHATVRTFMNVQADRTQEGSLVARRVGRRGRAGRPVADRREGHLQGLPDDARAGGADSEADRRRADRTAARSPSRGIAVQFQRMPNISLLPGERDIGARRHRRRHRARHRRSRTADRGRSIISATTSSSPDRRSTRCANGKIAGMLRDVAYQSNTPVFWNAMDMIGGKSSYWMGGSFNDGKGEPSQSSSVSHGCVPARFRNVTILNTRRSGMMPPGSRLGRRTRRRCCRASRRRRSPIACCRSRTGATRRA